MRESLPTTTFALDHDADLRAEDIRMRDDRTRFVLRDLRSNDEAPIALSLLGRFNVANALAAAGLALAGGYDFTTVASGLSREIVVPGRFESIVEGQPFHVVVDYAHTPDALATAVLAGRSLAGSHRVLVVFGCGGERDRDKRPLMGAAAGAADVAVLTSDNPRGEDPADIASEVLEGMRETRAEQHVELDRRRAIDLALHAAEPGDVVIIAGKGHEAEQTMAGVARPFDDRAVARELLGTSRWS
jgi:UDP-N-acetylmuramoyl-L-alanyl-D-glutamate--2,6-diaminopimelate ligase